MLMLKHLSRYKTRYKPSCQAVTIRRISEPRLSPMKLSRGATDQKSWQAAMKRPERVRPQSEEDMRPRQLLPHVQ